MDAFYGSFLPANSLCFDIGANIGNRVTSFRRLGHRVVALEPQPRCHAQLQAAFGNDPQVILVNKAVGSTPGQGTMMVSNLDVISTMSQSFIDATTKSERFGKAATWDKTITVDIVTLDSLIAAHGTPQFIKVDVEGYELEVVRGLSSPVRLISLEWTPELTDSLLACLNHLAKLGPIELNLSWLESMKFSRTNWMDQETFAKLLNQFREESYLFGDIYIRST